MFEDSRSPQKATPTSTHTLLLIDKCCTFKLGQIWSFDWSKIQSYSHMCKKPKR